jgi:hypothetical protein
MGTIITKLTGVATGLVLLFAFQAKSVAQTNDRSITFYQFRHVPDDKVNEFIKRETTYWSKVAQKAIDKKQMSFWALLERVGGYDLPNSPNYLFVNTYPDIDKVGEVWANAEKTTGVKMASMETSSLSTTTGEFFLHDENWAQAKNADPAKDFKYVVIIFHNSNYPDSVINLEKKHWAPFIQTAMDNGQTPQRAWGNAIVLSPTGENIKFNTVSYDLFKSLNDALMPAWKPNTVFPNEGLSKIGDIEINRRNSSVYRIVKFISSN